MPDPITLIQLWTGRLRQRWARAEGSVSPLLDFGPARHGIPASALLQLANIDLIDGVWAFDCRSGVSQVSQRWLQTLGYTPDDVQGQSIFDFWAERIHPEDRQRILAGEERQRSGELSEMTKTYRLRHRDGRYRWLHSHSIVTRRAPDGRPLNILGSDRDITGEREREEMLDFLHTHDELTGLLNRRQFHSRAHWMIDLARRENSGFALVRINLDHFGEINTLIGHEAGDALLCDAARSLQALTGDGDVLARMGSDEFALVLGPGEGIPPLGRRLEELRDALDSRHSAPEGEVHVSASIGVAMFPQDGAHLDELLQHAELAMSSAKRAGGHAVCCYTSAMNQEAQRKRRLLADLTQALARGEGLALHYQPIVELEGGGCSKVEALMRWTHPVLGAISPAVFIPMAEEAGLIHELGDFVMRQSQRDMDLLEQEGLPPVQFSVNLSPLQIMARNRVNWADQTLTDGVSRHAGRLCIEVTEGVLLARGRAVLDKLDGLRQLGIQIALDDFGTGYSSLSYLNTFHVDFLKIDRSFVSRIQGDSRSLALCEAMVLMAHKIGIRVIAEGIETPQQLQLLADMGCDFGQGYHLGRPMALEQLREVLRTTGRAPQPASALAQLA
ncbi:putative bifunctional diguanylate cyclase/phosphodiesterase [Amphibiibacter pelophylacis]|uniref:EAL domain-containing protein n=1 Tax=Amphibiibacter pelophylacis TaxID=1799477 RepID=A0ACC6P0J1_9BURK